MDRRDYGRFASLGISKEYDLIKATNEGYSIQNIWTGLEIILNWDEIAQLEEKAKEKSKVIVEKMREEIKEEERRKSMALQLKARQADEKKKKELEEKNRSCSRKEAEEIICYKQRADLEKTEKVEKAKVQAEKAKKDLGL